MEPNKAMRAQQPPRPRHASRTMPLRSRSPLVHSTPPLSIRTHPCHPWLKIPPVLPPEAPPHPSTAFRISVPKRSSVVKNSAPSTVLTRILSDLHFDDATSQVKSLAMLRPLLEGADRIIVNGDALDSQVIAHGHELIREVKTFFAAHTPEAL